MFIVKSIVYKYNNSYKFFLIFKQGQLVAEINGTLVLTHCVNQRKLKCRTDIDKPEATPYFQAHLFYK